VIDKFVADYKAAYPGDSPSTFAGHAYDAFQLAVAALGQVGTDGQKLRDQLESVKGFAGVSGVFTMAADNHSVSTSTRWRSSPSRTASGNWSTPTMSDLLQLIFSACRSGRSMP